jgi:hypothetical protein
MARQGKTLPARQKQAIEKSLLIKSAESLGRMIGSLQRQLEAARQLTTRTNGKVNGRGSSSRAAATKAGQKSSRQSTAAKARATSDGGSKRAAKPTGSKKTAGRSGAGPKRRTAKTNRGT